MPGPAQPHFVTVSGAATKWWPGKDRIPGPPPGRGRGQLLPSLPLALGPPGERLGRNEGGAGSSCAPRPGGGLASRRQDWVPEPSHFPVPERGWGRHLKMLSIDI